MHPEKEENLMERLKPYIYSISIVLCLGGFNIVSKVSLDRGMNQYVLVAYGFAFATLTSVVLALLFERKNQSKLSLPICLYIFFLGFLGVFARILLYAGIQYTSPTFAAAMNNLNPSVTFVLALLCRMEKLDVTKLNGQAMIGGTIISFVGATLMTLYKGITLISMHTTTHNHRHATSKVSLYRNLMKGSVLLLVQSLSISAYFILQTITIKKYPAPLTLTTLMSLAGTLIAIAATAILDHRTSSWRLSWDITLLAPLYSGILLFGISTYVQALVVRKRGPVFLTAFVPLSTVVVAIMSLLILGEALHLGGIVGGTLIIIGLYVILWGKEVEKRQKTLEPALCEEQDIEAKVEK
ncbi:WAT1-related protein At5g07050-like isoform X1 [Euphorbia lathyris]|uniref:WAT1-related protein At5g07050-like isoform X1 n=1 Tax=Euphorbia lathyris TaxID=212925 RepID=UPI0033136679